MSFGRIGGGSLNSHKGVSGEICLINSHKGVSGEICWSKGVDRLDMIKGVPQKLLAFEKFLEDNPNWRDKVVLLQIAVPTRTDVPEYQKLTCQVHEIVGRINGKFGTLTTVPIHHLDRSLDFHALCALYAITVTTKVPAKPIQNTPFFEENSGQSFSSDEVKKEVKDMSFKGALVIGSEVADGYGGENLPQTDNILMYLNSDDISACIGSRESTNNQENRITIGTGDQSRILKKDVPSYGPRR
ncbi:alpha,alpha-trehalose-phosphate synthase [UDP-forming] 1-like protein [Tanacetum coccineum]